ncbi:MAG: phage portal protein, partial [Proteobacteria bacterium]|nr:phage portal protein [Pseudomonadota bacterium]
SQNYNGFYSFYDSYTGEIIGGVHKLSFADEIRRSVPIQTVISNQLGVINSAELQILKTDKDKTDQPTTYQPALDFLDILKNPNAYPSPKHWNDIVRGLYKTYLSNGIVALVLKGAKSKTIDSIEIASSVTYNNSNNVITYNIQTTGKGYSYTQIFEKDNELGAFTNGDDVAIIFGNFDDYLKCYQTVLQPLMNVILWNNYIITASRSFYENSCRPSSIITVKFLDGEGKVMNSTADQESMIKVIAEVKNQLKGSTNTGKVILPSHPNLDITVTPLSITQNANDIKEQLALTKEMIYSAFTGANTNVIEGVSEYSNNRLASLREFYDGTISTFTNIILDELNAFLAKWLQYVGTGNALQRQGIYLNFDIGGIKFYKDLMKQEFLTAGKEQILKRQEVRSKLGELDETYADLEILPPEEDGFVGEKKSNTL